MFRKAICLMLCVGLLTLTIGQGQVQSDRDAGAIAGHLDAGLHTSEILWGAAGLIFSVLGVFASYLTNPSPPVSRLLGKSPEYLEAYGNAFTNRAKGIQTRSAWIGCIIGAVLGISWGTYQFID